MIYTYVKLLLTSCKSCVNMKIHREKSDGKQKRKFKKVVDKDKTMWYSNRVVSNRTTNIEHWQINSNATLKILMRIEFKRNSFNEYSENKSFITAM